MKCELLAEQNLALMLDFIDDENTKYDDLWIMRDLINGFILRDIITRD